VTSHPIVDVCSKDLPYPTGIVITLATSTLIPLMMLGVLAFKLRKVLLVYVRNCVEYALSRRTDLNHRLIYEFQVGNEQYSNVLINSNRLPEPLALGEHNTVVIDRNESCVIAIE